MINFDPTIGLGSIITFATLVATIIGAWYKFGGRLDLIEFRVKSIEETLKILSEVIKSIADTEKKNAVMDERQLTMEKQITVMQADVQGLKRGEGYIQIRRATVDGEYKAG